MCYNLRKNENNQIHSLKFPGLERVIVRIFLSHTYHMYVTYESYTMSYTYDSYSLSDMVSHKVSYVPYGEK